MGNATADLICQGSEVIFNINNSLSGIGQNYRGSYYIIDFGDGEDPEIFTHAELLIDNSSADSSFEIPHNFQQPSCEIGDGTTDESSQYKVDFDMFNKFRKTSTDANCDDYESNGAGVSKYVNVAQKPEADFIIESTFCMTSDYIFADNQSEFGEGFT